jgi:predicted transcriptional regulator
MASKPSYLKLSRRERQIMDALYRLGDAPVAAVLEAIPDPPSYSAVRAKLAILEEKGYVEHVVDGPRYLYRTVVDRSAAETTALRHVLQTFFGGSVEKAVAALVRINGDELSEAEINRLSGIIEESRKPENGAK